MHPLHGKVALITGGSSGIGRGAAASLAAHGARLALVARTAEPLEQAAAELRAAGAEAVALPADVADAEQCRRAVEAAVERYGGLDVLICSAGVSLRGAFADCDLAALERVFRINYFGTLYCTHYALPHVRRRRGSLVAVSSLTGKRGTPYYAVYGSSKFAIQGLYQSLRLELAADGVHVGVVAPGFVDTPLRRKVQGPDGRTLAEPPATPFRVWPLARCVERLVRLIVKRQPEALLPAFVGPLLALDQATGGWLGDRLLARRFAGERRADGRG
jgi:NAD(P)-dependent dehydrogenase (short-subunit alcohol dehydrogenase family)